MALTYAQFILFVDKITAAHVANKGTVGTGYGGGDDSLAIGDDWGVSRKVRDLEPIMLAFEDYSAVNALIAGTHRLQSLASYRKTAPVIFGEVLVALDAACLAAGVGSATTAEMFAAYYNTGAGGPYNALLPPDFQQLSTYAISRAVAASNLYSPAIANMGQRAFGGAFVAGTAADSALYAGVAVANSVTSAWAGVSGTLTVTGSARTSAGAVTAGRTFTATVAGSATVALAPAVAGDILISVSDMTLPAGMSAGTTVVAGAVPTGRTNPPT